MSLLDNESIPRRKMVLFFLIDKSGSMYGTKIGSVNDAIENVLPIIGEISDENPDAEINVAALEFSTTTRWLYNEPKSAKEFIWQQVEAEGMTSLGEACLELNKKLSRSAFMSSPSGSFAPAIILLSDGGPTDNFEAGLNQLKQNNWFKNAVKIAIAIGNDADKDVLKDFTGSLESVVTVHNLEALKTMIRIVAITTSQIGSTSTIAGEGEKQKQVNDAVNKGAEDTDGADPGNTPPPADAASANTGDDIWD